MTADKPEAGRTCKPWCGTGTGPDFRSWCEETWCTRECAKACAPLNPAPRPVEPAFDTFGESMCGGMGHGMTTSQPRPVERCSCEEATRYKAALEEICGRAASGSVNAGELKSAHELIDIAAIARRALALGGEAET